MPKKNVLIDNYQHSQNIDDIITSAIERKMQVLEVFDQKANALVRTTADALKQSYYKAPEKAAAVNVIYKVVYPDELNLKPILKPRVGRRKKVLPAPPPLVELTQPPQKSKTNVVAKTRSGREVKFPKYIQADFKKIDVEDNHLPGDSNNYEIKVTDFVNSTPKSEDIVEPKVVERQIVDQLDSLQKKRKIPPRYRCPKCNKAYLGRSKILDHLKKNPSHGPMHQTEENHFEVWNYLVSITQKCPSSERGPKFCQELSNLLHNLLLLTNALFKKLGSAANEVKIDKVLGNAIGLCPGTYYFDDNNLYKDVTVLQLMGNTDFLNSIRTKSDDVFKSPDILGKKCNCGKSNNTVDELVLKSMEIPTEALNKSDNIKIDEPSSVDENHSETSNKQFARNNSFASNLNDYEMKTDSGSKSDSGNNHFNNQVPLDKKAGNTDCDSKNSSDVKHFTDNNYFSQSLSFESNNFSVVSYNMVPDGIKRRPKSPKIKIQSNILICPPNPKFSQTNTCNNENQSTQRKNQIIPELLSDNSVLMPIANLQHPVDELMLPVTVPGSILDNSSSSDDVMNVDQFVNERFRKITESDLEVTNSNSLNLELPALDMFQFHTT